MKTKALTLILIVAFFKLSAQNTAPDFKWGNTSFYNLNVGDSLALSKSVIVLKELQNQSNLIAVGADQQWLKVSKNQLPKTIDGLRIYIADNKNVKNLTNDNPVHGLLKKDALIAVVEFDKPLLDLNRFVFPVSFNDGFLWSALESSNMFAYTNCVEGVELKTPISHPGIDIDLRDARGLEKHWLVAIENTSVVWVEKNTGKNHQQACVLLKSRSNPNIFYVYDHLFDKTIEVKKGEELMAGQLIGTAWGDSIWGHVHLSVVYSEQEPGYENRFYNLVNFFPQLYELYNRQSYSFSKNYSKGSILFGAPANANGNQKNCDAFEEYVGRGWILGRWNKTNTVEFVTNSSTGNVRLKKILFQHSAAQAKNPNNWYDYEINVQNGVYRIRAQVGDIKFPSWQKISFEGITAATYSLDAGKLKWTGEKVVKVTDRKLTVRIYIDPKNEKVAGLNELVFQRAY